MVVSGKKIEELMGGDIIIEPYDSKRLNPNSYNLSLHNELLIYKDFPLDMKFKNPTEKLVIPEEGIIIEPGKLYLGRTTEYTVTKKHVPILEGRSSVGRLGLSVHITAGFGDVGFAGYWTLELWAVVPVRIYSGIEICQISYHSLDGDFEPYSSNKYQNNKGIQSSRLYKDFESK